MTDQEWLVCADPDKMLQFLRGKASDRKLRLFACACCRLVWQKLSLEEQGIVAEVEHCAHDNSALEGVRRRLRVQFPNTLFEEGDISDWGDLRRGIRQHDPVWPSDAELHEIEWEDGWFPEILFLPDAIWLAGITARAVRSLIRRAAIAEAIRRRKPVKTQGLEAWRLASDAMWDYIDAAVEGETTRQVSVLHDLCDRPLSPQSALKDSVHGANVFKLAHAIYNDRAFDRLPVLADALEAAGCDNQEILNHCRGPGPHVRGCWALDLVLGKR